MIILAAAWIWLGALALTLGVAGERGLERLFAMRPAAAEPGITLLLGLLILTTGGGLISLILPMRPWGVVLAGLAAAACGFAQHRALLSRAAALGRTLVAGPAWRRLLLAILVLDALAWSARPVALFDTGAYHAQAVRWVEEQRAVPGLANLEPRLALVPTWFQTVAISRAAAKGGEGAPYPLNGWLLVAFGLALFPGVEAIAAGRARVGDWVAAGALVGGVLVANEWLSSPTADVPVALLPLLLVALACRLGETEPGTAESPVALVALSLFAASLRPSGAPMALLAGWAATRAADRRRAIAAAGLLAALLATPVLLRNAVLTGYPLFPLPWPALHGLDWTLPAADVGRLAVTIRDFARDPFAPAAPGWGWIGRWLARLPLVDRGALLWTAVGGGVALITRDRRGALGRVRPLVAILFVSAGCWFLAAPDPRFGRGVYFAAALLLAAAAGDRWWARVPRWLPVAAAVVVLTLDLARATAGLAAPVAWWRPPPPPRGVAAPFDVGAVRVWQALPGELCWEEPFPCVEERRANLAPRGVSLDAGFRPRPRGSRDGD